MEWGRVGQEAYGRTRGRVVERDENRVPELRDIIANPVTTGAFPPLAWTHPNCWLKPGKRYLRQAPRP